MRHRHDSQRAEYAEQSRKTGICPAAGRAGHHGGLLRHITDPGHAGRGPYSGTFTGQGLRSTMMISIIPVGLAGVERSRTASLPPRLSRRPRITSRPNQLADQHPLEPRGQTQAGT
jgi:hypothetical protein